MWPLYIWPMLVKENQPLYKRNFKNMKKQFYMCLFDATPTFLESAISQQAIYLYFIKIKNNLF